MFHSDIQSFTHDQLPIKVVDPEDVSDRETLTSTVIMGDSPKNISPYNVKDDETVNGDGETNCDDRTTANEILSERMLTPKASNAKKVKTHKRQKSQVIV